MSDGTDLLGAELGELRDAVQEAALGVSAKYDRAHWLAAAREERFPLEMWELMAEQGLLGLGVPEEYGGSGPGMVPVVAAMETMSAQGVPIALYLLTHFAREAILHHGTEEQKQRYVTPSTTGEERICFAITEPDAGTNSFKIDTFAEKLDDGNYRLNGQKIFISAADAATRMMVVCRTKKASDVADRRQGMSLLMVDMDAPGLELQVQDIDILMPDQQFAVFFVDVDVPAENVIGEDGEGFRYMFSALNPERMLVSAWALGIGDYALAKAVTYARERAPFGDPIGKYQGIQHPLARAKVNLDAARMMMYTAARVFDEGGSAGYFSNCAKLLASESATNACDAAMQTHGGYAFTAEYDVSSLWPIARLLRIAPINNEMVLNYIGEHILRLPKSY